MPNTVFFPWSEYWWFYVAFIGFVTVLLLLDLGVFHKESHEVTVKESAIWSTVWISLAGVFAALFYYYIVHTFPASRGLTGFELEGEAKRLTLEFVTGFLIEKSLAVDNIFIFIVVFNFFHIPRKYQHQVLFYGIFGALFFRSLFIAGGSFIMQIEWVAIVFGVFLIFTGLKLLFTEEKPIEPEKNLAIRALKKVMPVTHQLHGKKFFIKENHKLIATPLFVCLVFIEVTDIIFAADSVPAIFAITTEPLIVFTSNIFAILGLRSLYFMLAGVMHKFYLLKYGLGIVLSFVGLKMAWLNEWYGGKFPIHWSLGIIGAVLGGSVVLSLLFPASEKK